MSFSNAYFNLSYISDEWDMPIFENIHICPHDKIGNLIHYSFINDHVDTGLWYTRINFCSPHIETNNDFITKTETSFVHDDILEFKRSILTNLYNYIKV